MVFMYRVTVFHNSLDPEAHGPATFGAGTGRIWLANVLCTGNERELVNCNSSVVNSCTHSQDAGVRCPPGKAKIGIVTFFQNTLHSLGSFQILELWALHS